MVFVKRGGFFGVIAVGVIHIVFEVFPKLGCGSGVGQFAGFETSKCKFYIAYFAEFVNEITFIGAIVGNMVNAGKCCSSW